MPYVNLTMAAGRTLEAKQSLMAAVAQAVHESLDTPLDTVRVWITEIDPEQMSVGGVPLDEVFRRRTADAEVTPAKS